MASAHDRAVLQAIFNPTAPFGDDAGLNQTEALDDDGECMRFMSLHITSRLFMFITLHHIEIIFIRPIPRVKGRRKTHDILIQLDLCMTRESFLRCRTCQWSLNAFHRVYLLLPDSGFDTGLLKQVKALELQGVSAAEAGDLKGALQLFSQAIEILPRRASAYNNRAQALRLRGDTAGTCHRRSSDHSKQHGVRHIRLAGLSPA